MKGKPEHIGRREPEVGTKNSRTKNHSNPWIKVFWRYLTKSERPNPWVRRVALSHGRAMCWPEHDAEEYMRRDESDMIIRLISN